MNYRKMVLFMLLFLSQGIVALAQNLNIKLNHVTVKKAMAVLKQKSGHSFVYEVTDVDENRKVSVNANTLHQAVEQILQGQNVSYKIQGKYILLKRTEPANQPAAKEQEDNRIKASGHVTDSNGEPLIGAYVKQKGTTNGTVTDIDGKFSLDVPAGATIVITHIGSYDYEGKASSNMTVHMQDNINDLNEVVVVGYGTQKKVNLTGAVSVVDSKEITDRKVVQTSAALQGIAPGVTVTQSTGQPGLDGGTIRIRGIGTLNNSSPLVIVDGVESDLDAVDAASIESISILKDAASSAIYGSKAANGVILVTTKRAKTGRFSIDYNFYLTKQSATDLPKKVNALDHITMLNEAKINAGAGAVYSDEDIANWREHAGTDDYPDTDWQDVLLKGSGILQSHNIVLQGGNERLHAFASLGYINQDGIVKNVNYEKFYLRLNTDMQITKNFSTSFDLYVNHVQRKSVASYSSNSNNGSGIGYIFYSMNKLPAVQAAKYSNGLYGEGQNGENPLATIEEGGFYKRVATPITGSLTFRWEPIKDLNLKAVLSPSLSYPLVKSFINTITTYNSDGSVFTTLPTKSSLTMTSTYDKNIQTNFTADYLKKFKLHTFKIMGGMQYQSNWGSSFSGYREDIFEGFTELNAGGVDNMQSNGSASENALLSYFGRFNYNFAERYLFEFNARYDGSSKFADGHKWGFFPSVSAGWRISEEPFWENLKPTVPNLKLRASWGKLGNQNIDSNYAFASNVDLTTKYVSDDQLLSGGAITTMSNNDITWETTTMTDFGVDLNLFNKVNVTFDWYYKKTKDILMRLSIPLSMGVNATYQNAGVVRNKGWELNIAYNDRIGDFKYNVAFNISDVKNKILDLKGIEGTDLVTNREGYAISSYYMLRSAGILSSSDFDADGNYLHEKQYRILAPGDLRYVDTNGDGKVDDNDREVLGSSLPRYTYGLSLYGEYKGFDVNILLQGVGKRDGYVKEIMFPFYSGGTAFEIHKNHWSTENPNPNADFPRLYFGSGGDNNIRPSDFYLKSAAYLRLKNLQVGYRIPETITRKFSVSYLRVYFVGENLFTITNFWDGWDPEISAGSNGGYYPQVKSLGVGVQIKF